MKRITGAIALLAAAGCAPHPLASLEVARLGADVGVAPANMGYYQLASGRAKVALTRDAKGVFSVTAEPALVGDASPEATFAINYDASASSSDIITVARDSTGVITSVSVNSKDESANIAIATATFAAALSSLSAPPAPPSFAVSRFTREGRCALPDEPGAASAQVIVAPGGQADVSGAFGYSEDGCLTVSVSQVSDAGPRTAAGCDEVTVRAGSNKHNYRSGVYYRPLGRADVTVRANGAVVRQFTVPLPDERPENLGCVPVSRFAFVQSKTTLSFLNGAPTTIAIEKPSTALAVANWPLDLIKAVLSAPATLLTLRVENVKQETELVNALAAQQSAIQEALNTQSSAAAEVE